MPDIDTTARRTCIPFAIFAARDLGFSVEQISELLVLWRDRDRASADVKAMALSHVAGLKAKFAELQAMAQTLVHLTDHCHGNDRPDCPIIADLAESTAASAAEQCSQAPHRTPRFGSIRLPRHAIALPHELG